MGEIVEFPKRKIPAVMVETADNVSIISLNDVKGMADGSISIAEFESPEEVGKALAIIAMEYLNGAD